MQKLREFLQSKNLTNNDVLNYIKESYMANDGNFEYHSGHLFEITDLDVDPVNDDVISLNKQSPVCGICFSQKVWLQFLIKYRQDIKADMEDTMKNRRSCWYGINCRTMVHSHAHARRLDHLGPQTKF